MYGSEDYLAMLTAWQEAVENDNAIKKKRIKTLHCVGCGRYISPNSEEAYVTASGWAAHMKALCLERLVTKVEKANPGFTFMKETVHHAESD